MRSLCVLLLLVGAVSGLNEEFVKKLEAGLEQAKGRIEEISKTWEIDHYPNFLKTCSMHKTSLEILKWKYMRKILSAHMHNKREKFVVSFTGSSVTAGHDSFFNETTTPVVGRLMTGPLAALDVDFESRNVALGNNPCVPYDVCVKVFVGEDADMVHWEQNYFCGGDPLEYFIRQAMTIPTRPIVVFSTSSTGHWEPSKCAEAHVLTEGDKKLLAADLLSLVTEHSKETFHNQWGDLAAKDKHYHGAAVQAFTHHGHEDYACQGPYIAKWMEGAASWHPSAVAHRLRGSHHAYFWLGIWRMALQDLRDLAVHRALEAIAADVEHHLTANYPPMPPALSQTSPFIDNTTCFTDYEPRAMRDSSLKAKVRGGLVDGPGEGWRYGIYEDLVDANLVKQSHAHGYLDFKYMLYSKDNRQALSLTMDMPRAGPVFVCQTPGIWGKLPDTFVHLWEGQADFFVTLDVPAGPTPFVFDEAKAVKIKAIREQIPHDLCVQLLLAKDENKVLPIGHHVVSVRPHDKANLIVAWLLTP